MRCYFSAACPCALRTGGAPVGFLHGTTVSAEISDEVLTEFIPANGNLQPISFVTSDSSFDSAPDGCDIFRSCCYTEIRAVRFVPRCSGFRAIAQGMGCAMQGTVFECGGTFLCVQDADGFDTFPLPNGTDYSIGEEQLGNRSFLRVFCRESGLLLLFSEQRTCVLRETVQDYSFAEQLHTKRVLADAARHTVLTEYSADEQGLHKTTESVTVCEQFSVDSLDEAILPFAFFQELCIGGDCAPYLCDSLKERAPLLKQFLGDFCAVLLPQEQFYRTFGTVNGVGLAYPCGKNLYDIRFFRAELSDRTIKNILPVE